MRKNSMTKCAVGAMLFGGTLGMSQAASAGLVFNLTGPTPPNSSATLNYALSSFGSESPYVKASDIGFGATTLTLSTGLSASWTATTDTTGFSVTVLANATTGVQSYVQTNRSFTVTGTQEITLSWSGSYNLILGKSTGGTGFSSPISAPGWSTSAFGGSSNGSASGSLTTTLSAGTYWLNNNLDNTPGASFSFAVVPAPIPAPGALALLGVAGIVGARRRRA